MRGALSLAVALSMAFAAGPATAAEPQALIKVAAPGLSGLNLDAREVDYFTTQLVQQLTLEGIEVTTPSEVAALLGLERQKQLLGCSDSAENCMAEIAGGLDADGMLRGTIGRFADTFQLDVKIVSASSGKSLAVHSTRVEGQDGLLAAMPAVAASLAKQLGESLGRPVVSRRSGAGLRKAAWPTLIAGGAAALIGGALIFQSERRAAELSGGQLTLEQAREARDAGTREQQLGLIALGVGGAAVVAGAVMLAVSAPDSAPASASVVLAPGAAFVVVRGALP